jgi:hypothetical protein
VNELTALHGEARCNSKTQGTLRKPPLARAAPVLPL